jgi:hypothetical protein
MNYQEAVTAFRAHVAMHEANGVYFPEATSYLPDEWKRDYTLAMDAQPALSGDLNAGVPALFTTMVDPTVYEILFSPNKAAVIFSEQRKGTWLDETIMFPQVEHIGEVSSYGDYNENGTASANANWPQRQSYLFQTLMQYGERELARAGLARINWVSEVNKAAATVLNKYQNLTYFFGVANLQTYGALTDPLLTASLTPAVKANGGTGWIKNGAINATANEIYADIEALYLQLVIQTAGLIDQETKLTLALAPGPAVALTATNSFNVNVSDLIKKNFPNLRVETAMQYGQTSASNPQGIAAGNLVQLIADEIEGQKTGFCAFNDKARAHKIVRQTSSFKQKITAGSWGFVLRMPNGIASMLGV